MAALPPRLPTLAELGEIAERYGLGLGAQEVAEYRGLMAGPMQLYRRIDELGDERPATRYPRTPGHRPAAADNPFNAWYWRCAIEGAPDGPLRGCKVGVKDTICVAGVPMMNGTRVLEGYVPDVDATVVTRLLDAGATIVGKTTTPEFTIAGGRHESAYGPVLNPRRPSHSAGASSSGSGAAVAAGDVPMALGGDQGGSIRYPASWCGIVGLKPTFGLVPYTGCMPIELTLDHVGPMTDTVESAARMLTALAGPDPLDPRQRGLAPDVARDYRRAIGKGVLGLRVAALAEGFGHRAWGDLGLPASAEVVDRKVREAIRRLAESGAEVAEVSLPMHCDGTRIAIAILIEGMLEMLLKGAGTGTNWEGYYDLGLQEALGRGLATRAHDLPANAKYLMLLGEHMRRAYGGRYYAKAQNLRRRLRAAYDALLAEHDVLVMPSVPILPFELAAIGDSLGERIALSALGNQCQFNVTGHPALSVPCAMVDGLPVGLQIVGRHFGDLVVLRVGDALEKTVDWQAV